MLNKSKINNYVLILLASIGVISSYNNARHPSFSILQKRMDYMIELDKRHSIIQSFVSTETNLSSLWFPVFVRGRTDIPQSNVSVCLIDSTYSREIACNSMLMPGKTDIEEINFSFPIQSDSLGRHYQISIKTDAPAGVIYFWSSSDDKYPNGDIYVNGEEMKGDLAFRGYYRPNILTLIRFLIHSNQRLLILTEFFLIFSICGFLILNLISSNHIPKSFSHLFILSTCVGLAFPSIFLYTLITLNYELTKRTLVFALMCLIGLLILIRIFQLQSRQRPFSKDYLQHLVGLTKRSLSITIDKYDVVFLTLFLLAIFSRVLQVDNLMVPNWTDGLAHQRALSDLFYNRISPTNQIYHFGYHLTAFFAETLSGLTSPEATLIFGQWLSVAAGMSFYLLAQKCFNSKLISLICLSFYWFLSPFPLYLISWGRYPILLGISLLPTAIIYCVEWLSSKTFGSFLLSSLFSLSLSLAHYSIFVFWIVFLFSFWIFSEKHESSSKSQNIHSKFFFPAQIGVSFLLFSLFYLPKTITALKTSDACQTGFSSINLCIRQLSVSSQIFGIPRADINNSLMTSNKDVLNIKNQVRKIISSPDINHHLYLSIQNGGKTLLLCGILGLVYLFQANRKLFYGIFFWLFLTILISLIQYLLFDTAVPSIPNIIIILPILLTLLSGFVLQIYLNKKSFSKHIYNIVLACVIGMVLFGAYGSIGFVNPITTLYTEEDNEAIEWIRQQTNSRDLILINSFYWGSWCLPSDGGGWITPLTRRNTVYPISQQEYADIQSLISIKGVNYVYLGNGYGVLQSSVFKSNDYNLVYQKNGIQIYKVNSD